MFSMNYKHRGLNKTININSIEAESSTLNK